MADPFVAEIRIFPFNFAPRGWALCNGQLMSISQNSALFSLIGTTYGGDGRSSFGLPNLQGSAPMHPGQGPGLTQRYLGEAGGSNIVSLLLTEMPAHSHSLTASPAPGSIRVPAANVGLARAAGGEAYVTQGPPLPPIVPMSTSAVGPVGGNQPHNNMMPYLTFNFCISLQGVFPQRP